jgi:hypothetical protein
MKSGSVHTRQKQGCSILLRLSPPNEARRYGLESKVGREKYGYRAKLICREIGLRPSLHASVTASTASRLNAPHYFPTFAISLQFAMSLLRASAAATRHSAHTFRQQRGLVSTVLLTKQWNDRPVADLRKEAKARGLPT